MIKMKLKSVCLCSGWLEEIPTLCWGAQETKRVLFSEFKHNSCKMPEHCKSEIEKSSGWKIMFVTFFRLFQCLIPKNNFPQKTERKPFLPHNIIYNWIEFGSETGVENIGDVPHAERMQCNESQKSFLFQTVERCPDSFSTGENPFPLEINPVLCFGKYINFLKPFLFQLLFFFPLKSIHFPIK